MREFLSSPDTALGLGLIVGVCLGAFGAFMMRAELYAENRRLRRDNARLHSHPATRADSEPTVALDMEALVVSTSGLIVPAPRRPRA